MGLKPGEDNWRVIWWAWLPVREETGSQDHSWWLDLLVENQLGTGPKGSERGWGEGACGPYQAAEGLGNLDGGGS